MMMTVMKHIAPLAALLATSTMPVAADDAMANPFALMSLGNGQLDIGGMEQSILALAEEGASPELLPFIEYIFNLTHDMKVDVVEHFRTKKDEIEECYETWGDCQRQIPTPHNYDYWNQTHRNCSDEESALCIEWEECVQDCEDRKIICYDQCPPDPEPPWNPCPGQLEPALINDPLPCFPRCNADTETPRDHYVRLLDCFAKEKADHEQKMEECWICHEVVEKCFNKCDILDAELTAKKRECTDHQTDLEELVCHCNSGNCTRYYQCHTNARNLCLGKCDGIDDEVLVLRTEYEGLLRVECYLHSLVDNIRTGFSLYSGIQACRSYSIADYLPTKPGWQEFFNRTVPNGTGWIDFTETCNKTPPAIIPCGDISGCDPLFLPGRPGFIVHHYSNMPYCTAPEFVHASCHGQVMIPVRPGNMVKLLRGMKALNWDEEHISMHTNLHHDSQRWALNKCKEHDFNCLLNENEWSTHSNHTIFDDTIASGEVISFTSKLDMDGTFDCFTQCTPTKYPPQSGHWAALFLMFKVDAKGDRVPARTPVSIGDVVYFHGMKSKDQWVALDSNKRMLDCNDDHCGVELRDDLTVHAASFVLISDQHWGVYEEGPLVSSNVQSKHCNSDTVIAMSQTQAMEVCDASTGCNSLMSVGGSCTDDVWLPCNTLVSILVADSVAPYDKCTLMKTGTEVKVEGADRAPEAKANKSLDYENLPAGFSAVRDLTATDLQKWQQARAQNNDLTALGDPAKVSTNVTGENEYFLFIMKNSVRITILVAPELWPHIGAENQVCAGFSGRASVQVSHRGCQDAAVAAGHHYYEYASKGSTGRSSCKTVAEGACPTSSYENSNYAYKISQKPTGAAGTVLEVVSIVESWRH